MAEERRVELLVGRRVVDAAGDVVGRLEEIIADYVDGEYVVREYHVGAYAVFERLAGGMLGAGLLRLIGGNRLYDGYVIPWDVMDLSDPDHPRATARKVELPRIDESRHPSSSVRSAEQPRGRRSA